MRNIKRIETLRQLTINGIFRIFFTSITIIIFVIQLLLQLLQICNLNLEMMTNIIQMLICTINTDSKLLISRIKIFDKFSMLQKAVDQQKRRLIEECLKNLVSKTKDQATKATIQDAYNNFKADSKMQNLMQFFKKTPVVKSALRVLSYEYNAWKLAFYKLTDGSRQEYSKFSKFDIQQFLLSIQSNVKFDMSQFQREYTTNIRYTEHVKTYVLEINKLRTTENWPKQFVTEWRQRKQKTLIELEKSRTNQYMQKVNNSQGLPQPGSGPSYVPLVHQKSSQAGTGFFNKQSASVNQSTQNAITPQLKTERIVSKSESKTPNIQTQQVQQKNRQKPGPKPKNPESKEDQSMDDYSADNAKRSSKQKTIRREKPEAPKPQVTQQKSDQPRQQDTVITQQRTEQFRQQDVVVTQRKQQKRDYKIRVRLLCAYLQKRKDLNLNPVNIKNVAEFLNKKLQILMRGILEKTITAAKLRNYNYSSPDAGDQFKYFSKENKSIEWTGQMKVPKNQEIYRVRHPSKLQLYSQIRVNEQEAEEKIERELSERKEGDKKRDSKILEYLLAPRQFQTQAWMSKTQAKTGRLVISNNHVQSVLEQHPIFCDGIAMFKSLHS